MSQSHEGPSPNAASAGHCAPPESGTGRPSHEHTCQRYSRRPSISLASDSASTIGPTPDIDTGGRATIATWVVPVVRAGLEGRTISESAKACGRAGRLLQAARQELLQALARRLREDDLRVALFFGAPLVQEHHMIRHVAREAH